MSSKAVQADRRTLLMGGCATLAMAAAGRASAQSDNADAVRRDYARIFGTADGSPSSALLAFQAAQEARTPAAVDLSRFRSQMMESPTLQALEAQRRRQSARGGRNALAFADSVAIGHLLLWTEAALELSALDHTAQDPANPPPTYDEQFGPARTSRVMAMFSLAVFEAVNAIYREFHSYRGVQAAILQQVAVPVDQITPQTASVGQAIASAAYGTLSKLYPKKLAFIDAYAQRAAVLNGDTTAAKALGRAIGDRSAAAILRERKYDPVSNRFFDQSQHSDPSILTFDQSSVEAWRQDPVSRLMPALGERWHYVPPFVLRDARDVLPPPPPAFGSAAFAASYKRVKSLGGDPRAPTLPPRWPTPTARTGTDPTAPLDRSNQTFVGIFWGYDGTALLCAPLRLYNMIAISVALKEIQIERVSDFARYLALINVAMGDAGIAAWTAKYHYMVPRPVTYIRAADADTAPDGQRDEQWTPLGAPVTNGTFAGRNLTPPFPAYPSGHATFGATLFEMMSLYFGRPKADGSTAFQFVSDEYNGINRGPDEQNPRPKVELDFPSFAAAERDNADSRVYLGVHWDFDADAGIVQGEKIARTVFNAVLGKV